VIRRFTIGAAALAIATAIAMVALWPGHVQSRVAEGFATDSARAGVTSVREGFCAGLTSQTCQFVRATIRSGRETRKHITIQLDATGIDPDVDPGDKIRVAKTPELPRGAPAVTGTGYTLFDFERRGPLLVLAELFALVVVVFARLRGAMSLAGLGVSLVIVLLCVVPAILDGSPRCWWRSSAPSRSPTRRSRSPMDGGRRALPRCSGRSPACCSPRCWPCCSRTSPT
jgi:hypothetical protein